MQNTLLDHEAQVSLETSAVETTVLATSAPKSKRQSGRQGQNRNNQRDHDWKDRKDITCYHCLRKGHYEADCKLKKCEEFRRKRQKQRKQEGKGGSKASKEDSSASASIVRALIRRTHATRSQVNRTKLWFIDSAASDHMTTFFQNSRKSIDSTSLEGSD